MTSPRARLATERDVAEMAGALASSFHDDPVMTWIFGDHEGRRLKRLRPFFTREGARHLRHPHVMTTDDHAGASFWDPPGAWKTRPSDYFGMAVPMLLGVNRRIPRALTGLGRLDKVHDSQPKDHFYLAVLGTRPDRQGAGVGSALMQPVLEVCDREGHGAYLESSKESNLPFYRRHGFEVVEEVEFSPGGPSLWAMWRDPREPEAGQE